jgi:hypothetical protein
MANFGGNEPSLPLALHLAEEHGASPQMATLAPRITSHHGKAAEHIARVLYDLLDLDHPPIGAERSCMQSLSA